MSDSISLNRRTDSSLTIASIVKEFALTYNNENSPDIYMSVDNGSSLKKFKPEKTNIHVVKKGESYFLVYISSPLQTID